MTVDRTSLEERSSAAVTLYPGGILKTDGHGDAVTGFSAFDRVYVEVVAPELARATAAGAMTFQVEGSDDEGDTWASAGDAMVLTGEGQASVAIDAPKDWLRLSWTMSHIRRCRVLGAFATPGSLDPSASPGGSISVTDGSTTVDPATSIDFSGATVTDEGGGVAGVAVGGLQAVNVVFAGANIPTAQNPVAVVFSSDSKTAYVANSDAASLSVIDVATATVTSTTPLGTLAASQLSVAITPDDSTLYISSSSDGYVAIFDIATLMVTSTPSVGLDCRFVAINPAGTKAYVTNSSDGTFSVIDVATGLVTATPSVGTAPGSVAFTPDGAKAYICNTGDATVTPITVSTNTPGAPIASVNNPNGLAITPDGATAYITNGTDGTVTAITVATDVVATVIATGVANADLQAMAISPDQSVAYICDNGNGSILPLTLPAEIIEPSVIVGSNPSDVAFAPDGSVAYITQAGSDGAVPLDPAGAPFTTDQLLARLFYIVP